MSTLMQAKFERCGTPIPMKVDKREYLFQENPYGDFVAIVDSEEHVHYLEQTGNFARYKNPTAEEWEARQKKAAREKVKAEAHAASKLSKAKGK